jgi:hypothetical protein
MKFIGGSAKSVFMGKRISISRAIKLHKQGAMDSMITELKILDTQGLSILCQPRADQTGNGGTPVQRPASARAAAEAAVSTAKSLADCRDSFGALLQPKLQLASGPRCDFFEQETMWCLRAPERPDRTAMRLRLLFRTGSFQICMRK